MDNNKNSRIVCNLCNVADTTPVIHCSVCCSAYQYKCVFPDVPPSMYEHILKMSGIQWYCPTDRHLSVSKLLDRLSFVDLKLMEQQSTFNPFANSVVNKTTSSQTSPVKTESGPQRRILRPKRNASATNDVVPKKKSKEPLELSSTLTTATKVSKIKPPHVQIPTLCVVTDGNLSATKAPLTEDATTPPSVPELPSSVPSFRDVVVISSKNTLEVTGNLNSDPTPVNVAACVQGHVANGKRSIDNLLVAVPPNRSIFLSRLKNETSEDDIKNYIIEKLSISSGFGIRKFDTRGSKFASFLLRCDDSIYKTLINTKSWPKNMKVERFFQKGSRRKNRP
ncbi:hypothetical protein ACFFRR_005343 [Megaselia abdita]